MTVPVSGSRGADALRWGGALLLAAIAVFRCVVLFAPRVVFDVDPMLDARPLGGLGPAGSLALDALTLLAAAAALGGEWRAGRRVDLLLLLLLIAPVALVVVHGRADAGDRWLGSTWLAAVAGGVAAAHLARDPALRRVVAVLLLAVLGPLLVRGAANVTYEHAQTVAQFEQQEEAILRGRGWTPGSSNAEIFKRRLYQRQPSAWFLTTNVFASYCAFGAIVFAGLAAGAWRSELESGWTGVFVLLAVASAGGLIMTGSKGAIGVALLAGAALVAPFAIPGLRRRWARLAPIAAIGLVLLPLAGVVVRGAAMPEDFAGDRSLLFRWHYMTSSAAIVREAPLAGVGPDGYQAAYVAHRHPRNPEEVASSHSVFWDWVCAFGLAGAAWGATVLVLVWRAGRRWGAILAGEEGPDQADAPCPLPWRAIAAGGALGAAGVLAGMLLELHALDALGVAARLLGALAYAGLAVGVGLAVSRVIVPIAACAWIAGAIALVMHGQIEMTWTQPASALWLACVLGLAAGAVGCGPRALGTVVAVVLVIAATWTAATGWWPAQRQERLAREAAATIAGAEPGGPAEIASRREAAEILDRAWGIDPTAIRLRIEAVDQLDRAARVARGEQRVELLRAAAAIADEIAVTGEPAALAAGVFVHHALAQTPDLEDVAVHRNAALDRARRLVVLDPNGLSAERRLADLLWAYNRRDEARAAYERVLEIHASFELDPLKQLSDEDRAAIEARVGS